MKGFRSKLLPLVATIALLGAGVASAAALKWSGLTQVTVKALNGSLPPGGGKNPQTMRFKTPAQLAKVTAALNNNKITWHKGPGDPGMCAGGVDVTLTVAQKAAKTKHATAYLCGDKIYGGIGGNVKGFMKALGMTALLQGAS